MPSAAIDAVAPRPWPPAVRLSDGAVEALKWLALILMTFDHLNKYLLRDEAPILFDLGRLAMPLFAVTLGFNLGRAGKAYGRVAMRLAVAGAVASLPFIALGGLGWGWWPLNIMFTLLLATLICQLLDIGGEGRIAAAFLLFIVGGSCVEFWWPGVALCVAAWGYARRPSWAALVVGVMALSLLRFINGNDWALAAVPVLLMATQWRLAVPRHRYLFYAYYPLHLSALWLLKA